MVIESDGPSAAADAPDADPAARARIAIQPMIPIKRYTTIQRLVIKLPSNAGKRIPAAGFYGSIEDLNQALLFN
jgi:hypothetical protein